MTDTDALGDGDAGLHRYIIPVFAVILLTLIGGCVSAPDPAIPQQPVTLGALEEMGQVPDSWTSVNGSVAVYEPTNVSMTMTGNLTNESDWTHPPNSSYPEFDNESIIGGCWTGGGTDE